MKIIILDGKNTLEDVVSVARYHSQVAFSDEYIQRVQKCRDFVDEFSKGGIPIYGVTTGLGDNWRKFIPEEDPGSISRGIISLPIPVLWESQSMKNVPEL